MPPVLGAMIAPSLGTLSIAGFAQGTIGFALLQVGSSMLLSAAANALMPKPSVGMSGRQVTVRQPVMPREIVYGRARKGGTIAYLDVTNGNLYLDIIIVLASHRVKSIGAVYFNGRMAFQAGSIVAEPWLARAPALVRVNGDANQLSPSYLTMQTAGKWTAAHRLRGCAYVYLRLIYGRNEYPQGLPNITVDIEGKDDILDPRTGTRGYSENPALCLADYMSLPNFGIGAAIGAEDGIDTADLIAGANICDEIVPHVAGGTEPRYSCNGVITLNLAPKTIIESLLTSMAGSCVMQAGQWHIYPGAYRTPTLDLTDDDVAGDGAVLTTRISRAENCNGVRGQFVAPENNWQPDDFPAYSSAVYLAEDGGEPIWRDINLPFTISSSMAQRLAKIELERTRRQMSVEMSTKLSAWRAAAGDVVTLTRSRWGFAAKPFDVVRSSLVIEGGEVPTLVTSLSLRETSPLVYDWSVTEAQIYAAAPRTTLPSAFDVAAPTGLMVSEALYVTQAGGGVKAKAVISWGAGVGLPANKYQVEARFESGPWQLVGNTDQTTIELLDIASGTWEFRVKSISSLGVSSGWISVIQPIFGLLAPPEALANVTLQTAGGLVILKWSQHPSLDVRIGGTIEIRHSTSASPSPLNSYSMDAVPGAATIAVVPQLPGTYLLRAIDSSGGLGPITYIAAGAVQAVPFASVAMLQEDPGFAGAKTDTGAVAGSLRIAGQSNVGGWPLVSGVAQVSAAGGFKPVGQYAFQSGINLGAQKRIRLRNQIEMLAESTSDLISARLGNVSSWQQISSGSGREVDVVVEARTSPDDPSGSPTWGPWGRVDSTELLAWGVQARAILTSRDATFTPAVTKLRLFADEAV